MTLTHALAGQPFLVSPRGILTEVILLALGSPSDSAAALATRSMANGVPCMLRTAALKTFAVEKAPPIAARLRVEVSPCSPLWAWLFSF